jgi:hypothetical protein
MGFGRSELHALARTMDFLHHTTFAMVEGRPSPDTGLNCIDNDHGPKWKNLSQQQRGGVLNRCVDWTHFEPHQVDRIIENIAAGKERVQWFDGVPMSDGAAQDVRTWIAFEKMPEEEQLREAARRMKRSKTLGGRGVMVHVKWEEMNDRQRFDVIHHELRLAEGSEMPYRQWEEILREELGGWPGEGPGIWYV